MHFRVFAVFLLIVSATPALAQEPAARLGEILGDVRVLAASIGDAQITPAEPGQLLGDGQPILTGKNARAEVSAFGAIAIVYGGSSIAVQGIGDAGYFDHGFGTVLYEAVAGVTVRIDTPMAQVFLVDGALAFDADPDAVSITVLDGVATVRALGAPAPVQVAAGQTASLTLPTQTAVPVPTPPEVDFVWQERRIALSYAAERIERLAAARGDTTPQVREPRGFFEILFGAHADRSADRAVNGQSRSGGGASGGGSDGGSGGASGSGSDGGSGGGDGGGSSNDSVSDTMDSVNDSVDSVNDAVGGLP